jgi:glycosyltransferase involved in cell wall biosynthesis
MRRLFGRRAPTVSVVMKAYNHERFVAQAIRSALDQSMTDFEIVITDDGSTDATAHVIESFEDPRIRFERSAQNRGIAATMDATVRRARGEFLAVLNSDDFALPERFTRQVDYLRAHPNVAAVFSLPLEVDEDGQPDEPAVSMFTIAPSRGSEPTRAEWLHYFFFNNNCLCAPSVMVRRSAFMQLTPDDRRLPLLGDYDRWIRLLQNHDIHVMRDRLTAFRRHGAAGNASAPSAENLRRHTFESLQIIKQYLRFPTALLREIFDAEIEQHDIHTDRPAALWLAEIALLGRQIWHPMFALQTLFDAAVEPHDIRRLFELAGAIDPFNMV